MNAKFLIGIICLFVSGAASATAVQSIEVFKNCGLIGAECPATGDIFDIRITAFDAARGIDYDQTQSIAMGESALFTSLWYYSDLVYTIQELVPTGWELTNAIVGNGLNFEGRVCSGQTAGDWCGMKVSFQGSSIPGQFEFRNSPVPIPAAVWLFGSGLLGLVGMARRKKAA